MVDYYLTIEEQTKREIKLKQQKVYKIGRLKDCEIRLSSTIVSGVHCIFWFEDGQWYLSDFESSNGTYLNGARIEPPYGVMVTNSDVIEIGSHLPNEDCRKVRLKFSQRETPIIFEQVQEKPLYIRETPACQYDYQVEHPPIEPVKSSSPSENWSDFVENAPEAFKSLLASLEVDATSKGVAIELKNITKYVKNGPLINRRTKLLDDISLSIPANHFVAVVGGSGAGKSTLLNCINGENPPTTGEVLFDNLSAKDFFTVHRSEIGNVPQKDILHEGLSVMDALIYTAQLKNTTELSNRQLMQRVNSVLKDVEMYEKKKLLITRLSGGQKKRISIAMELLSEPKLLLLDEPTSGLSPDLDKGIMQLLQKISRKNCTVIVVTHAMDNIQYCDKVAFLGKGGQLCFYDSPEVLLDYFKVSHISEIFEQLTNTQTVSNYANQYRHQLFNQGGVYG